MKYLLSRKNANFFQLFSTPQRFVEYLDLCAREPQFWPVVLSCLEECAKVPGSEGAIESIRVMNSLVGLYWDY